MNNFNLVCIDEFKTSADWKNAIRAIIMYRRGHTTIYTPPNSDGAGVTLDISWENSLTRDYAIEFFAKLNNIEINYLRELMINDKLQLFTVANIELYNKQHSNIMNDDSNSDSDFTLESDDDYIIYGSDGDSYDNMFDIDYSML